MNKIKKLSVSTLATATMVAVLGFFSLGTTAFAVVMPSNISTRHATVITQTDATLNGKNEDNNAGGHSFWASLSTFDTSSPTLPAGVFSTPDLGAISAHTDFSALLSSVSGLPAITANTTYYFAAWSNVDGTWYPGEVKQFTTSETPDLLGTLSAEDFGVVNYDTGLGIIKGYSAGFGLTDATFAGATSVSVKLYSAGDVLLQTNTAILPKFNADITGIQISSPFDVSGAFDYATDGYWTNVRGAEYGQSVPATKVVATVTLANGKVVTATNTTIAGDPTTIFPTDGTGTEGTIGGTVTGGASVGTLAVTSVTTVNSTATADGTFTNGWKYIFHITVPTNETNLAMKFANWVINGGGSTIPVANNMRISSVQADNSNATVLLTAENTYSSPTLHMTGDLNPAMDGEQVDVLVETAIPLNSVNGAYSTSYGVKTN